MSVFYVIAVVGNTENQAEHLEYLNHVVAKMQEEKQVAVSQAWVQDERDLTAPGEAQYQRRVYVDVGDTRD